MLVHVHEKLLIYLDENGIKQGLIARKANIPAAVFGAMLNGKRVIDVDDFRAICLALNVIPENFIETEQSAIAMGARLNEHKN